MKYYGYEKVSPRGRGLIKRQRIWKGSDHLLAVTETGYTEEFKRYYFSDIQSFTILWSKSYVIWAILLPMISLLVFALAVSSRDSSVIRTVVFTGAFASLFIIHLLRGPTCKCWIDTGINHEYLFALRRVSQAQRFWARIEPDLTAAQGEFSLEEMERLGAIVNRSDRAPSPNEPPKFVPNEAIEASPVES
ncbi:MAG: hypothetical protein JXR40_11640 [Pontiellaceae bacterium]|nr:hypothetical protein [Pontiellaceae bacterium]